MNLDLDAVAIALEKVITSNYDHMDDYHRMADEFARTYYAWADEPRRS